MPWTPSDYIGLAGVVSGGVVALGAPAVSALFDNKKAAAQADQSREEAVRAINDARLDELVGIMEPAGLVLSKLLTTVTRMHAEAERTRELSDKTMLPLTGLFEETVEGLNRMELRLGAQHGAPSAYRDSVDAMRLSMHMLLTEGEISDSRLQLSDVAVALARGLRADFIAITASLIGPAEPYFEHERRDDLVKELEDLRKSFKLNAL